MPSRPIGSATISFGLVSIPVSLYAASESSAAISFNLLHDKCRSRLKQSYVCPKDGEKVERDQMVKGYEFEKGQYVVFTPEELKALEEQANQIIEITEFVPLAKVDPLYYDKGYYLGPGKGGDRAYRLLSKAMTETGRCGLARYAARGKQYLVIVRPIEGGLMMQQLHYKDEIRPFSEVEIPDADVRENELKLAIQLTDQIASDEFHPENYADDVKKRVEALIQKKIQGEEITAAAPVQHETKVVDLIEALKASLKERPARRGREGAPAAEKEERKPAMRAPRGAAEEKEEKEKARPLRLVGGGKRATKR